MKRTSWLLLSGLFLLTTLWQTGLSFANGLGNALSNGLSKDREMVILARALAYDRNLASHGSGSVNKELVLVVLTRSGAAEVQAEQEKTLSILRALSSVKIQGLSVKPVGLAHGSDLAERLQQVRAQVVYVPSGMGAEVTEIREVCQRLKILSMGGLPAMVRAGLSLGASQGSSSEGGQVVLLIHLTQSRKEGADFGAELLRLAEVIR